MPTSAMSTLFKAGDAIGLVGLTRSQLREWTSRGRRELVLADIEPDGPGRHAKYAWQTLLVLRLLLALHTHFATEVGAWAPAARQLRTSLEHVGFQSLWGSFAFFPSPEIGILVDRFGPRECAGLIMPLEPHLIALASKLSFPQPIQLSLFHSAGVSI